MFGCKLCEFEANVADNGRRSIPGQCKGDDDFEISFSISLDRSVIFWIFYHYCSCSSRTIYPLRWTSWRAHIGFHYRVPRILILCCRSYWVRRHSSSYWVWKARWCLLRSWGCVSCRLSIFSRAIRPIGHCVPSTYVLHILFWLWLSYSSRYQRIWSLSGLMTNRILPVLCRWHICYSWRVS